MIRKNNKNTNVVEHQRLVKLRYNRIDVDHLAKLTVDFCEKKKLNPKYQMSNELGELILVIVEKMLGQGQYRGYTDSWKEEMAGKAYEHVTKYIKNFRMEAVKSGKPDAAFSYYAMIVTNAFKQALKNLKAHTEKNTALNEAIGGHDELDSERSMNDISAYVPNEDRLDYGGNIST